MNINPKHYQRWRKNRQNKSPSIIQKICREMQNEHDPHNQTWFKNLALIIRLYPQHRTKRIYYLPF